ncbi:MAG TPA: hypothetical protein VNL92_01230, partial [Dehalococcoidia bacterium]|nr:hypothetical protein [Dehalococcoidia bacterium]
MSDVDVMVYDMFGSPPRALNETQKSRWGMMPWAAHELSPKGVPGDYDWFAGARPGLWTNFAGAITPWGQVYEASTGSPVTDVRIHIRNMELYFLHADG